MLWGHLPQGGFVPKRMGLTSVVACISITNYLTALSGGLNDGAACAVSTGLQALHLVPFF